MNVGASLRRSLEGLGRRPKFAILMLAAWAPVMLSKHPFLAAIVLLAAAGVFLAATRRDGAPAVADSSAGEIP